MTRAELVEAVRLVDSRADAGRVAALVRDAVARGALPEDVGRLLAEDVLPLLGDLADDAEAEAREARRRSRRRTRPRGR